MRSATFLALAALAFTPLAVPPPVAAAQAATEKPAAAVVQESVERAVAAKTAKEQQAAFDAIAALGCRAAPAVGAALDDPRQLPFRDLAVGWRPGERHGPSRQYTPETVTDALAALLSEMTWQHFGVIYNGATAAERAQAVALWRQYLERPLDDVCGPEPQAKPGADEPPETAPAPQPTAR